VAPQGAAVQEDGVGSAQCGVVVEQVADDVLSKEGSMSTADL
jgi:hypothetical protein